MRRVIAWPFRLIALSFEGLGRLSSLLLGFVLMVGGAALGAGPMFALGIPVFAFGLFLMLRALG